MASALTAIFVRRGWSRNAARLVCSLRDHADRQTPAIDEDDSQILRHADRETALLNAILRGYIKL